MSLDARELAAIFAGGAAGALLRAWLSLELPAAPGSWPWVTFVINVIGAFTLGFILTRLQERLPLSTYRRPLLGTGFCGAFTTFSTMQLELLKMVDHRYYGLAVGYALGSIACGYLAIYASTSIVRRVRVIV